MDVGQKQPIIDGTQKALSLTCGGAFTVPDCFLQANVPTFAVLEKQKHDTLRKVTRIIAFMTLFFSSIPGIIQYESGVAFMSYQPPYTIANRMLNWALSQVAGEDAYLPEKVRRLLDVMECDVPLTEVLISEVRKA